MLNRRPMKITVRIPYVVWRDGRPRFVPGPELRTLGFKGENLRRPDGRWLDVEEARAWAEARMGAIEAAKSSPAGRGRGTAREGGGGGPRAVAVEDIFEDLWKLKKFREPGAAGALRPATARDYRL